jgi:hypothetical protein
MPFTRAVAILVAIGAFSAALGGTASATDLTSPEDTVYTSTIAATSEGHVVFDNPIAKVECESSVEGKVESHGEGVTAKGNVSSLTFTGCTNSWHVTVVAAGSLEVHPSEYGDGTVTSSGVTIEATRLGVTCRYATSNTSLGTLTGSYSTEGKATLDVDAAVPFHSGSIFCGAGATSWTGSYTINTPEFLTVDANAADTVRLCEKEVEPCPDPDTFPSGTEFVADPKGSGAATFKWTYKGVAKSTSCTETKFVGKTTVKEGVGYVKGSISKIEFPKCAPICEVTVTTLPSELRIRRNKGFSGLMQLKGDFKYKINCPGEGHYCVYTGTETNGTLVPGSPPKYLVNTSALINLPGESFDKNCGTWLSYNHEWRFEKPQVAAVPKLYVSRS